MKKSYISFLIALLLGFPIFSEAGPIATETRWNINIPDLEVPGLIITEFRGDENLRYYVELTNVSDVAIDLSQFSLVSGYTYSKMLGTTETQVVLANQFNYVPLEGILEPGESYTEMSVWDLNLNGSGFPRHHIGLLDVMDRIYHIPETTTDSLDFLNKPEWQTFGKDSVSDFYPQILMSGTSCYYLEYKFTNGEGLRDSTLVDNVNFAIDPNFCIGTTCNWGKGNYNFPVAGIEDPVRNNILVRKASIQQGNLDWNLSRGTDAETSEWLVLPKFDNQFDYYTTIGSHGAYSLDFSVKDSAPVSYDDVNKTLTVPWDFEDGQTLNRVFDFGPGMAWDYSREDSASSQYSNVQSGDVFTLYATGNTLEALPLTIIATEPAANMASAFSYRYSISEVDFESGIEILEWYPYYQVTQGQDVDSIYGIPYALSIDTLLQNLYKPEKASWEIEFVDGSQRANLKRGDKLVVTSEDGTNVKEYVIQVNEYIPSNNINLATISWPDYDPDIYWQWESDTIPGFSPSRTGYTMRLVAGTTTIPALNIKPQDINATMQVQRATHINGTPEQRTTTVTVTAESGEVRRTYTITFELESTPIQPNIAEPFFSEMKLNEGFAYALEIYNPGTEEIDLSRYMIAGGFKDDNLNTVLNRQVTNSLQFIYNNHFVPGYRFKNDTNLPDFQAENGILVPDNVTNTIVPAGETWVVGASSDGSWPGGRFYPARYQSPGITTAEYLDFCFYGFHEQVVSSLGAPENAPFNRNPWGLLLNRYRFPFVLNQNNVGSLFLLKILNDSILDGTKDFRDPNDYEIVDRLQKSLDAPDLRISGYHTQTPNKNGWSLKRMPHVWRGVTERGEGLGDDFGQSAENSQWYVYHQGTRADSIPVDAIWSNLGMHSTDPITAHLSFVTSTRLKVDPGYEGSLNIGGEFAGLTVELFEAMLDKADPGQTLEVLDGTDVLAADAPVAAGMVLRVTSFDGQNVTLYTLVETPLSSDNLLVAKTGSELTVSLTGPNGLVDGVALDITIRELLDMLEVPANAILNVVDAGDNLVPLTTLNFDSVAVDVKIGPGIMLEVVAENGDAAMYSLGFTAGDALLLSYVLDIDQDIRLVQGVPVGVTAESFQSLVFASEGATIKLTDRYGYTAEERVLNYDDEIIVTSADGMSESTYKLKFVGIDLVGNIMASVAFMVNDPDELYTDGFILVGSWDSSTGVFDEEWHEGAQQANFYDDGTNGDEVADDNIWTVNLSLALDMADKTWQWGFTDLTGTWLPSDTLEFQLDVVEGLVNSYTITGTSVPVLQDGLVRVYPNPARTDLIVEGIDLQSAHSVQIFNVMGQQRVARLLGSDKINVSNLESGLYILRIMNADGNVSTVRFLKK